MASCSSAVDTLAVVVSTPAELFVKPGTDVKLSCTFTSSEDVSSGTTVTWSFQPEGSAVLPTTFFHYSDGKEYPGKDTEFNGRCSWAGNLAMKDASIKIVNMQLEDTGTYVCDVKNPPDIVTEPGNIKVTILEGEIPTGTTGTTTGTTGTTGTTATAATSGNISFNGPSFWPLALLLHFSICSKVFVLKTNTS
ncbi:myelin protein zero-like protein 1 [Elgaria multicarinata webbii]|uniref:myelin protein zero-like protein 1 n=1 Tax=Elgaria multicarinata webbii TaxID=159646 RepID=UPI002FCD06A0